MEESEMLDETVDRECRVCNNRSQTLKSCDQCGHRMRMKKKKKRIKDSDTCIEPSESGWFWGEEENVPQTIVSCSRGSRPLSLKPLNIISSNKSDFQASADNPVLNKLDSIKSLHRSHSFGSQDSIVESLETLPMVKRSQKRHTMTGSISSCVLWGSCLENAVSEFEAKEIILIAEIDSDERCMSVLAQRLKIEDASRSKYTVSNATSQLRTKYNDLEKKVRINHEKLIQVQARLNELRAQQDSDPSTNNRVVSNQDNNLVLDSPPDPEHEQKKKKKKHKKKKKKREEAAIKIQRCFRVLRARRLFSEMVKRAYQRVYDPDTKQYFYYNQHTRQSQWEIPPMLIKVQAEQKKHHTRRKQVRQPSQSSLDAAASRIQSLFRRRAARIALKNMLSQVYEKIYDAETNSYYYYCKNTKTSTWEKPKLLQGDDLEIKATFTSVACTREQETAARKIQSIYRNRAARLFILDLAMGKIEKHFDTDSQAWYYYNHRTQQTFWEHARHSQLSTAAKSREDKNASK